jgi:CDP-glycerol glycerophosphotransferase
VETTDDLIAQLREVDTLAERYAPAYARFRDRFCDLDDGHAAERVLDAVFDAA